MRTGTRADGCPHCGFFMNLELDRICPRCKKSVDEQPEPVAPPAAPAPAAPADQRLGFQHTAPVGAKAVAPPAKPFVPPSPPGYGKEALTPALTPTPGPGGASDAPPLTTTAPLPALKSRRQANSASWLMGIGGVAFLAFIIVGGIIIIQQKVNSPEYKAQLAWQDAVESLEGEEWQAAVSACRTCLKYDNAMSEAAYLAGIATLQIADKDGASDSMDRLLEEAKWGHTSVCDVADAWMHDCIKRCDEDPDRHPVDRSLVSNRRTKASALSILFLTSILRAAAASEAKQYDDQDAWLAVAKKHLEEAEATDPTCPDVASSRKLYDEVTAPQKTRPPVVPSL